MTTFALVHGAWHDAWCWERVTRLLQRAGHNVVAPDLPCDDGAADFDSYANVLCGALRGCDDDVVVVGHSLGGPTATLVAARRPARHLVYLCSVVLEAGVSLMDQGPEQMAAVFADGWLNAVGKPDEQGRMTWVDFDFVRTVFYPRLRRIDRGGGDRSPATTGRASVDAAVLLARIARCPLHLRRLHRRSGGQRRVVEANRPPHRRRHRGTAGRALTASRPTVSSGRRLA